MHDLRLAVRALRAHPIVSILAILSLALGIGANTAIFSLVNGLLLRPLPVKDPSALVLVTDTAPGIRGWNYQVSQQLRDRADFFAGTLAWSPATFNLASRGETQFVEGLWVSGGFFETLGVAPLLGRGIVAADDRHALGPDSRGPDGPVAVIGYGFWQRRFGGAADVIGRTLTLDDVPFTIVGVTPPAFFGAEVGRTFDVIAPFASEPLLRGRAATGEGPCCLSVTIMARLGAGQTVEAATAALRRVQPQIREATLPRASNWRPQDLDRYLRDPFTLLPGATGSSKLRPRYERPLLAVMVVVALVLLIACANIANLLLARAIARQHELQVRLALGAAHWRLARQLLMESLVLAAAGAALGVLMASWGSRLLVRQLSTLASPVFLDVSIDVRLLAFTIGVTVVATLLFGTAPALRALRVAAVDALKAQGRGTSDQTRGGLAGVLIVAQVALSVVLVVAAGLFLRTFSSLVTMPLGFDRDRVLMANVSAERTNAAPDRRLAMFERVRDAVRAQPGVADATLSFLTPVSGPILLRPIELAKDAPPDGTESDGTVPNSTGSDGPRSDGPRSEGRRSDRVSLPESERMSAVNFVSPGWFGTLGTPVLAGRDFTDRDRAGTPSVVVVNQAFVRKFLKGAQPLGRTVTIGIVGPTAESAEVVGVAADAVYASLRAPMPPTMYFPLAQLRTPGLASLTLSVRAPQGSPLLLTRSVAAAIREVHPDLVVTFRPLADQIDASLIQERVVAMLSGFFGGVGVLLAGLGLFGVTSHSVSRRRREIGIRIALGAAPTRVLRLVLSRVSLLVGIGIAIGASVSLWASRFVAPLLYGLEPDDPATLVGAAVLLAAVGLFAGWLPAWHAARIDPAIVLRTD